MAADAAREIERLRLALVLIHDDLCELEEFAGTAEVMRPIVRAQRLCRWDQPDWATEMDKIEQLIAEEAVEENP